MTEVNEFLITHVNSKNGEQQYHQDIENIVKYKPNSFVRDYHKNLPKAKPMKKKDRLDKTVLPRAESGKKVFKLVKPNLPTISHKGAK